MKISVSLPPEDIDFLDEEGPNRSAVLHRAIQMLKNANLAEQYQEAYREFDESGDAELWSQATGDGINP